MIELFSVTVPDAEVQGDGCVESRKFLVEYFKNHPELGDPRSQDPEQHLHLLHTDHSIPQFWRQGMLGYLSNVQYLRLIFGKENIEDAGEYIVNHPGMTAETDDTVISRNFTSLDDCYTYIKETVDDYISNRQIVWIQTKEERVNELGLMSRIFPKGISTITHSVETVVPEKTYKVYNRSNTYKENVSGNNVEQSVSDATTSEVNYLRSTFQIRKRLKPLGDNVWGDWWETAKFDPQAI